MKSSSSIQLNNLIICLKMIILRTLQLKLAMMTPEDGFPIALGVIRDVEAPTYNDAVYAQLEEVSSMKKYHNFEELLETNDIWTVE